MAKSAKLVLPIDTKSVKKNLIKYLSKKYPKTDYKSKNEKNNYINSLTRQTAENIEKWLSFDLPYQEKDIVLKAIQAHKWSEILEVFSDEIVWGTSSVRGKMTPSQKPNEALNDLKKFSQFGLHNKILQGTNTFNQFTLVSFAIGIANYSIKNGLKKIIIGYDNRVQSKLFAKLISKIFLKYDFKLNIFDDICSTPELAFSVKKLNADLGIIITASHNDKRYNGFKIFSRLGGPFTKPEKNKIMTNIYSSQKNFHLTSEFLKSNKITTNSLKKDYSTHEKNNLTLLSHETITSQFVKHLLKYFTNKSAIKDIKNLKIGFSAIHGTGYKPSLKLFKELGVRKPIFISSMIKPDSLFPLFNVDQILEPAHNKVYEKIIEEFIKQHGSKKLEKLDALLFTDPDSDRIGLICNVPQNEQKIFGKYRFVTGNELWTVLLWSHLDDLFKKHHLTRTEKNNLFVVKSFVTSDSIKAICRKFNVKCFDGNVGFSELTNIVQNKWKNNMTNVGIFEESNGFTIAGNPYQKSHVRSHIIEKDGFLGIVKILELLAHAKSKNLTFYEILDQVYTKNKIGYFYNFREQFPEKGSFDNILENFHKNSILRNVEKFAQITEQRSKSKKPLKLGSYPISRVKKYSSANNSRKIFPYEGIRFFFNSPDNHLTIRSSDTESKIRLFIQWRIKHVNNDELLQSKIIARTISQEISSDFKQILFSKKK
jgi:phosphomannomutase